MFESKEKRISLRGGKKDPFRIVKCSEAFFRHKIKQEAVTRPPEVADGKGAELG